MKPANTGFSFKPQESGLHQDQQGYFKEFRFQEGKDKLNLILLDNLDVERLYYTGNIKEAQTALKNFVSSKIEQIDVETMTYELSQLAIEHYTQQQQVKQQNAELLYQQFCVQKEKCQKIEHLRLQHEEKKNALKNQVKQLQEKISDIKQETLKIGSFKCIYCNKTFREREMLTSHVKRRHQEQLEEIKAQNELIRDENPVMKIKRLEEERKQMQEMVHLKQMQQLQRIHEREINEQKLIDQLGDKMEKDIHKKIESAFQSNIDREQEEQKKKREDQQKQQILSTVDGMKDMFSQFMSEFKELKSKQDEMSQLQKNQQSEQRKIKEEQQKLQSQNTKDQQKLKELKIRKTFEQLKKNETHLMVTHYIDNLADSVCSQEFQENLRQSELRQKERFKKEQQEQQSRLPKEQIDKDDKVNLFHIGDLISDIESDHENEDKKVAQDQQKKLEFEIQQLKQTVKKHEEKEFVQNYNENLKILQGLTGGDDDSSNQFHSKQPSKVQKISKLPSQENIKSQQSIKETAKESQNKIDSQKRISQTSISQPKIEQQQNQDTKIQKNDNNQDQKDEEKEEIKKEYKKLESKYDSTKQSDKKGGKKDEKKENSDDDYNDDFEEIEDEIEQNDKKSNLSQQSKTSSLKLRESIAKEELSKLEDQITDSLGNDDKFWMQKEKIEKQKKQ